MCAISRGIIKERVIVVDNMIFGYLEETNKKRNNFATIALIRSSHLGQLNQLGETHECPVRPSGYSQKYSESQQAYSMHLIQLSKMRKRSKGRKTKGEKRKSLFTLTNRKLNWLRLAKLNLVSSSKFLASLSALTRMASLSSSIYSYESFHSFILSFFQFFLPFPAPSAIEKFTHFLICQLVLPG